MAKEDLVSFKERTVEEQQEIARQGGIASGKARREKKLFREEIEKQLGKSLKEIVAAAITSAKDGNIQASTFLRDTIGEKPTDKLEAEVDNNVTINIELSDDE